jgi:hypothetical protein
MTKMNLMTMFPFAHWFLGKSYLMTLTVHGIVSPGHLDIPPVTWAHGSLA